jgi:hypothetical protein
MKKVIGQKKDVSKKHLKYETRKELKENSICCYNTIIKNKWIEDAFKHMNHASWIKIKGLLG